MGNGNARLARRPIRLRPDAWPHRLHRYEHVDRPRRGRCLVTAHKPSAPHTACAVGGADVAARSLRSAARASYTSVVTSGDQALLSDNWRRGRSPASRTPTGVGQGRPSHGVYARESARSHKYQLTEPLDVVATNLARDLHHESL